MFKQTLSSSILLIFLLSTTTINLSQSKSTKSVFLVEERNKDENKIEHYELGDLEDDSLEDIFDHDTHMLRMENHDDPSCPFEQMDKQNKRSEEKWKLVPSPIKLNHLDEASLGMQRGPEVKPEAHFEVRQERFSREGRGEQDLEDTMASLMELWKAFVLYHPRGRKELELLRDLLEKSIPVENEKRASLGRERPEPEVPAPMSHSRDNSELDQQNWQQYREPIFMYTMEQEKSAEVSATPPLNYSIEDVKGSFEFDPSDSVVGSASAERVRNSLLKAADVARQLASSTRKPEVTKNLNPASRLNSVTSPVNRNNNNNNNPTQPKFLGFGQLQRIEPFNGNGRTQARMSCQFGGERPSSNVTISNVEWAKFENYTMDQNAEPPFDCRRTVSRSSACRMFPVKTNTLTTVHPRPAIQSYINTMVPSYSVTLHEVNEEHLGVYRCSAWRQFGDGRREMVYRIIQFD